MEQWHGHEALWWNTQLSFAFPGAFLWKNRKVDLSLTELWWIGKRKVQVVSWVPYSSALCQDLLWSEPPFYLALLVNLDLGISLFQQNFSKPEKASGTQTCKHLLLVKNLWHDCALHLLLQLACTMANLLKAQCSRR